jgi:hypothetical protein
MKTGYIEPTIFRKTAHALIKAQESSMERSKEALFAPRSSNLFSELAELQLAWTGLAASQKLLQHCRDFTYVKDDDCPGMRLTLLTDKEQTKANRGIRLFAHVRNRALFQVLLKVTVVASGVLAVVGAAMSSPIWAIASLAVGALALATLFRCRYSLSSDPTITKLKQTFEEEIL